MSYKTQDQETILLRDELSKLLTTLKHNRENVPLDILKTRYKNEFDSLAGTLREKVLADLGSFYRKHLGLYITPECLEDPELKPLIYCVANDCVLQDGQWIPLELYESGSACLQEKCV